MVNREYLHLDAVPLTRTDELRHVHRIAREHAGGDVGKPPVQPDLRAVVDAFRPHPHRPPRKVRRHIHAAAETRRVEVTPAIIGHIGYKAKLLLVVESIVGVRHHAILHERAKHRPRHHRRHPLAGRRRLLHLPWAFRHKYARSATEGFRSGKPSRNCGARRKRQRLDHPDSCIHEKLLPRPWIVSWGP